MTMVASTYRTSHGCTDQLAAHILITRFTGQLKGWWDEHPTIEDKDTILTTVKIDTNGKPIPQDRDTI